MFNGIIRKTFVLHITLACKQKGEYYISYKLDNKGQIMFRNFFINTIMKEDL